RAGSIMRIVARDLAIVPVLYYDGIHDDTDAINAMLSGRRFDDMSDGRVLYEDVGDGRGTQFIFLAGRALISKPLEITRAGTTVVGGVFESVGCMAVFESVGFMAAAAEPWIRIGEKCASDL